MKLSHIANLESNTEDSGDHEYRGDFQSTQPEDITDDINCSAEAQEVLTDLESESREIEVADNGISEAVDAVEQINETIDVVSAQEESGEPITDTQIQTLEITHESIMRHLGLEMGKFPTLESFKQNPRGKQLIATMEASGEGILTKLSNLIGETVRQVIEFVQRILRNSWALGKYMDYLKKKVAALDSSAKPKAEEMEASRFAMSVNGKADASSVHELTEGAMTLLKGAMLAAEQLGASNLKFTDIEVGVRPEQFIPENPTPISNGRTIESNGFSTLFTNELYKVEQSGKTAAPNAKVLSVSEMNSALADAGKIITGIKAVDKADSKIKRFATNLVNWVAHAGAEIGGVVSKSMKEKSDRISKVRWTRIVLSKVIGKFPLEAFKSAKVILDYVRHSLKQYKDGADVKDQIPATK